MVVTVIYTLQGINISHLGKRKIIFKMPFLGGYVSSLEGNLLIIPHFLVGKTWHWGSVAPLRNSMTLGSKVVENTPRLSEG